MRLNFILYLSTHSTFIQLTILSVEISTLTISKINITQALQENVQIHGELLKSSEYSKERPQLLINKPNRLNLESLLNPLQNYSCQIVVNNFNGIDINHEFSHPWILRRPILAQTQLYNRAQLIWTPFEFLELKNRTKTANYYGCPHSEKLLYFPNTDLIAHDICLRIDQSKYVSASKPWNFQMDIDVLPQQYHLAFMSSPKTFHFQRLGDLDGSWISFEGPSFRVLVDYKNNYNIKDISNWYLGGHFDDNYLYDMNGPQIYLTKYIYLSCHKFCKIKFVTQRNIYTENLERIFGGRNTNMFWRQKWLSSIFEMDKEIETIWYFGEYHRYADVS